MMRFDICSNLFVWTSALSLQAAGFGDGDTFTGETFTGAKIFALEEMEVFAVGGYP